MGGQLQMVWPESQLNAPPRVDVPDGYTIRPFRAGDEAAQVAVMNAAGFDTFDEPMLGEWLRRVLPDGVFLAVHDASGEAAATAMAVHRPLDVHPFGGELGWVARRPEHRGRGLGLAVCATAVSRFLRAGYKRIYLLTDDWRLPAVRVYLKLGFVPFLHESEALERWRPVCEQLDCPFEPDSWPAVETVEN